MAAGVTGVIAAELARFGPGRVVGLDLDAEMLLVARTRSLPCVHGDAHALPFPAGTFDGVICHYLLLWLADPAWGVREMARVTRPGGWVIACAEPDYGGRVDYAPPLSRLGRLQAESLRHQGADPEVGRRLGELFVGAGLRTVMGVVPGRWTLPAGPDSGFEAEWAMRRHDLAGALSPEELDRLQDADRRALEVGNRVLFVPTFYALGKKPEEVAL